MILDLPRFIEAERPYWGELNALLNRIEEEPDLRLTLEEIERLHYLYQRASAALARATTFSAEPALRQTLESMVGRAYSEIHAQSERGGKLRPKEWLFTRCPSVFRKRIRAFALALLVTMGGVLFGGIALLADPQAKSVLMPFPQLMGNPSDRVAAEERGVGNIRGAEGRFAAQLMTHNIQVSLFAFALGITWGFGTGVLMFYNGAILGAVVVDYVRAGQTEFMMGWLMPHGVIEIPAILVAGQAGFVLASAIVGPANERRQRLAAAGPDIFALLTLLAVMLVWAGLVEAFLSQYHQPALPYIVKIAFGVIELLALILYLSRSGKSTPSVETSTVHS